MGDIGDDIKATAGAIVQDASVITNIEHQKEELDAGDPRLNELSEQAVDVADQLLQKATIEHALVTEANQER